MPSRAFLPLISTLPPSQSVITHNHN